MTEVDIRSDQLSRFRPIVGRHRHYRAAKIAELICTRLDGRALWNVNTTAAGGGVAEMLHVLLPYVRGAGADARWLVMDGDPDFFRVTKRLHHALHGSRGDGSPLDDNAHAIYDACARANRPSLDRVRPGDIVILHDPQTAGLAAPLMDAGALVMWRCHIGHDGREAEAEAGWAFLDRYLRDVPAFVFSRRAYVPQQYQSRTTIITPSIDAFSPKNQELDDDTARAILVHTGLVDGPAGPGSPTFTRNDGSSADVNRRAEIVRAKQAPSWDTPLVVQVSRWDPLKDMAGVMHGFARLAQTDASLGAHLVLAGPNVTAVTDDPEGAVTFKEVVAAWQALPIEIRERVHLASLPMADIQENAAIVNALQRHATIIVQKSLQEGFGLTVTEAMWKSRPIIASAVGGIQDQIDDGVHGQLLRDPTDLRAFAEHAARILGDEAFAAHLGTNAKERVRERFLGLGHLVKYARLIERLDRERGATRAPARQATASRTRRERA